MRSWEGNEEGVPQLDGRWAWERWRRGAGAEVRRPAERGALGPCDELERQRAAAGGGGDGGQGDSGAEYHHDESTTMAQRWRR